MATVTDGASIEERLERVEGLLRQLVEREAVREHYSIEELAALLGRSEYTVREWCRHGRLAARKQKGGAGPHAAWVVPHDELLRYRRDGLLPIATRTRP